MPRSKPIELSDVLGQAAKSSDLFNQQQADLEKQRAGKEQEAKIAHDTMMTNLRALFGGKAPTEADLQQGGQSTQGATPGQTEINQEIDKIAPQYQGLMGPGGPGQKHSVKFDSRGGVDVAEAQVDPFRRYKAESDAVTNAYKSYASELPKLRGTIDSANEGLQAVNDPNQVGSLGLARSLVLKSLGMNRYNSDEAAKSVPGSVYSYLKPFFTGVQGTWVKPGDMPDDKDPNGDNNPLDPIQRKSIASFLTSHIANAMKTHDQIAQKAQGQLMSSGYGSLENIQRLNDSIQQSGFKEYATSMLAPKPGTPPSNYNSPPANSGQPPPPKDNRSGLQKLLAIPGKALSSVLSSGSGNQQGIQSGPTPAPSKIRMKGPKGDLLDVDPQDQTSAESEGYKVSQ